MSIFELKKCKVDSSKILYILNQLTDAPNIKIDNILKNLPDNIKIFVYLKDNNPVGLITLLIEQKLIHGGKCVGHIEDLVVDNNNKREGIGQKLITHCIKVAKLNNCYKIILDCKEELESFYEKNNFKKQGICMRYSI
jgi:glucosamine-phosphate N-acetyltransferase